MVYAYTLKQWRKCRGSRRHRNANLSSHALMADFRRIVLGFLDNQVWENLTQV